MGLNRGGWGRGWLPHCGRLGTAPLEIIGRNPAFWFALSKKMCSFYGLLGVRGIAFIHTSNIGGGSSDRLTPQICHH